MRVNRQNQIFVYIIQSETLAEMSGRRRQIIHLTKKVLKRHSLGGGLKALTFLEATKCYATVLIKGLKYHLAMLTRGIRGLK